MRKVVFIYLLILCLSVFSVLGGNLFVRDVYAIPNSNVPAPDGHPHTCGIVGHADFIDGTVTWENGTGNWANGNLTNPDSTCHQHRDGCDFRILSEAGPPPYPDPYVSPQPYSPCAVWDNLQVRIDDDADFDLGHGFINEFPTAGGGLACIPRYAFSGAWNNDAKQRVRDAFKEYSDVESDKKWLATGIAFVEGSPAQITIYWENLVGEGLAYTDLANGVMRFDSNPDSGNSWEFGTKADTNNTEIHFYSTALHEVGHIVGLEDQCDTDDIMYYIERWEYLYNDTDGSGTVTPNDVRLYDVELSGTPPGYARGSTVNLGDNDERQRPRRILVNFNPDEKHDNTTGNNRYDWGEFIYRDVDNSGNVTAGDVRLEERGLYAAGSVVAAGDTDVGLGLVLFLANEKHEEFLPSNGRYDFRGPYLGDLDSDSIHGACDLYSIPAPDFGDAPDPTYPTKKASNGTRNLFIGREWLGANPTGQTTTTWEWDAKAVDVPDDGCVFWLPLLGVGIGFVDVTVSVTNWQSSRYNNTFGYELYLAIWIDWDENGWWDHPREMVVIDRLRPSTWGQNTWSNRYQFDVPCWSLAWARARLVYAKTGMNLFPWGLLPTLDSPDDGGEVEDYYLERERPPVGGIIVPVDKFGLLAPYVGLASTILVATVATAIYVKRVKHRKEKQ